MPAPPNAVAFETSAPADFGLTRIYVTQARIEHIAIGHRDISLLPHTLIKEAVERTTKVYQSHTSGRFVFMSEEITTKNGHPMVVVVERNEFSGEIITATWWDRGRGTVLWDATSGLYASLDKGADILYMSRGPAVPALAHEDADNPDIWFRVSEQDGSPVGITLFRATDWWSGAVDKLVATISAFLGLSETQIRDRLKDVMTAAK